MSAGNNDTSHKVVNVPDKEYLLVADKTSKVLHSTPYWNEVVKEANFIRRAGGEVTIFKATKG
jgi:hypothetical protein